MNPDLFETKYYPFASGKGSIYGKYTLEELNEIISEELKNEALNKEKKESINDKFIEMIKNLDSEASNVVSIIRWFLLNKGIKRSLGTLFQNKLLYLGFDESNGLVIPDDIDKESLSQSIISFFMNINLEKNDDSNKLSLAILNLAIVEYSGYVVF